MFIWQHLELDPAEVERIKDAYRPLLPSPVHFYQTLDLGIKDFMGMPVFKTVLIYATAKSTGMVHVDHRPHDNNVLAINIALQNCENSVTEFWKANEEITKVDYSSSNSPYIGYNRKNCQKIDEYTLERPVIFNTSIPHSVNNYGDKSRYAISLRFVKDPWHLISQQPD